MDLEMLEWSKLLDSQYIIHIRKYDSKIKENVFSKFILFLEILYVVS